jgi:molecular chaperone DnaJ
MMMKNYYLVLGVPRDEQDPRGIRDAYRQLAKEYHPDRAGPEGATALRDVVEAYEVLSHDEQRALLRVAWPPTCSAAQVARPVAHLQRP